MKIEPIEITKKYKNVEHEDTLYDMMIKADLLEGIRPLHNVLLKKALIEKYHWDDFFSLLQLLVKDPDDFLVDCKDYFGVKIALYFAWYNIFSF